MLIIVIIFLFRKFVVKDIVIGAQGPVNIGDLTRAKKIIWMNAHISWEDEKVIIFLLSFC